MSTPEADGTMVRLHVSRPAAIDPLRALDAFRDVGWLGRPVEPEPTGPGLRRVAADLELPIRDGSAPGPVRKAALIDLGLPRTVGGEIVVDLGWRSATLAPLFPAFTGELRIATTGLVIEGAYQPPFGRIGLVMDAALLHLVARRTAQAFLTRVADRLARIADARGRPSGREG